MKTSFVSNLTVQNAMRQTIARAQQERLQLQEESVTGTHADLGVALGVRTTRSLNLRSDLERMTSLISTNALTTQRLASSQLALKSMSEAANKAISASILTSSPSPEQLKTAKASFADAISMFTGAINSSFSGEFLFAGINTDVIPVNDYFADPPPPPAPTAKREFDAQFQTFFGFNQADPATKNITKTQMDNFISSLETLYMDPAPAAGTGWDNWSNASDQNMTSRISNSEIVQSSTNANTDGIRKFALGAVIGYELLSLDLSDDTRKAVSTATTEYMGSAISGVDGERSKLGISEARIKQANTSLEAQKTILTNSVRGLESIDTYEAATRLKTLETQLELAYTLTSKIQGMSLLNYL